MVELENVFKFVVGFDNMSNESHCEYCDSTIHYGHTAYVVEDEGGVDPTLCQKCFSKFYSEHK